MLNFDKGNKKLHATLYYLVANNEYFLKEFDKVVTDCSTSISLNPDYSSAYFYRGKVYSKQLHKDDLARQDFNKVISLDTSKKSVDYIFSLFYIGKGDEAAAILQKEVLSTTDEAQVLGDYYNLACLYALMNKPDEGNNYLKMAIDKGYAKKYIVADEDLDNLRNTTDYKNMMGNVNN
jgi:tetratricopeptide (TPR) repeat protein